ncbi:MAG: DUF952 domain-containing protein [Methylocella sp.]
MGTAILLRELRALALIGDVASTADLIYKIAPLSLWQEAKGCGRFPGAPADLAEGFIHSSWHVIAGVARRCHRAMASGQAGLLPIAANPAPLGDALRFEPSRNGALTQHLYLVRRSMPWSGQNLSPSRRMAGMITRALWE